MKHKCLFCGEEIRFSLVRAHLKTEHEKDDREVDRYLNENMKYQGIPESVERTKASRRPPI